MTALGSQVPPYAGSDMLVVGGNLTAGARHPRRRGPGPRRRRRGRWRGGRRAPTSTPTAARWTSRRRRHRAVPRPRWPARPTSAALRRPPGHGEGRRHRQRDHPDRRRGLDRAGLHGRRRRLAAQQDSGRSLQLLGVPQDATVVVNLTGTGVDLDVDSLLSPDGLAGRPAERPLLREPGHPPAVERAVRHRRGDRRPRPAPRLPARPDRAEHHHARRPRHQRPHPGGRRPRAHRGRASCTPTRSSPTPQLGCAADPVHLTTLDARRPARGPRQGRRPRPVLPGQLRLRPRRRRRDAGRQHLEAPRGRRSPAAVRPDPGRRRVHRQGAARRCHRRPCARGPSRRSSRHCWSSRSVATSASPSPTR